MAGEIESETAALLEMENIRAEPFSDEVLDCLPKGAWKVDKLDLEQRRDFRSVNVHPSIHLSICLSVCLPICSLILTRLCYIT